MNFFSGTISDGTLELPFAELPAPSGVSHTGEVIVGIRPEDFEDARFAPAGHDAGVEFTAPIEVVESMGSEIYVYFSFQGGEVSSDELAELARDTGVTETGMAVARLSPESEISEGPDAKLWFDGAKLHLFDPHDGANLRHGKADQTAAAEAGREAVAAEADEAPSRRAVEEQDEDDAAESPHRAAGAEPDERSAPE
jgi:multiple sugar transport system ATP-binding protein